MIYETKTGCFISYFIRNWKTFIRALSTKLPEQIKIFV